MAEESGSLFCDEDETCEKNTSESDEDGEEYVSAPLDKLGPFGRWLRHRLLSSILIGTPPLVALQRRRTPVWTKIMKINSFFGTEDFYIPMVVFILWIVDAKLGRLLCLLMGVGFYTAGFIKDVLCLPRPPNPPIVALESAAQTWGLPSHHAVLGVLVPWYIWFYSYIHFSMPQWAFPVLFFLIVYWSVSVMFSRLYLGVHSPADIVAGGIIGCIILASWIKIDTILDRFISFGDNVILQALVYSLLLLFVHPRPEPRTMSLVETVMLFICCVQDYQEHILLLLALAQSPAMITFLLTVLHSKSMPSPGPIIHKTKLKIFFITWAYKPKDFMVAMTAVTVGFVIGQATSTRQSPIYKAILDFDTDDVPYFTLIGISAVRLLLGYALVLLTRLLCKIVFRSLLSNLFRILDMECFDRKKTKYDQSIRLYSASFKLPPVFVKEGKKKRKSQPDPDDASAKWNMDYLVNYGTYICVGWMAISGVPLLSHSIGLVL